MLKSYILQTMENILMKTINPEMIILKTKKLLKMTPDVKKIQRFWTRKIKFLSDQGQHNQVPDAEVIVDPRGQRPQATVPYVDPGGQTYAIGAPTSSYQGHMMVVMVLNMTFYLTLISCLIIETWYLIEANTMS